MSGQKSHSLFFESMNRAVLQSGNPGVSARTNGSPHFESFFARPAP